MVIMITDGGKPPSTEPTKFIHGTIMYAPPIDGNESRIKARPRVQRSPRYSGSAITSRPIPAISDMVLQNG